MATATQSKPARPARQEAEQVDWPIFVCHNGICIVDPRVYDAVEPDEMMARYEHVRSGEGIVLLPACRANDELLQQPPLGLRLSGAEAKELINDTLGAAGALAATDFGIDLSPKDKGSNQDFALSATFRLANGKVYQFAAVADGVTTRTLWPERSARLAVLAAWRSARRHVREGSGFSHADFESFLATLSADILTTLEDDMVRLETAGTVPPGWSLETHRQFKGRRELWYNSTLLFALVGAEAGFVATCGDGGAVVRKRGREERRSIVLVGSTDDLSVSGIVSFGPGAMQFRKSRIAMTPDVDVEIILATDGVDRSLRRAQGSIAESSDPYDEIRVNDSPRLQAWMTGTLQAIDDREQDNISAAVLRWPAGAPVPLAPPEYRGQIKSDTPSVQVDAVFDAVFGTEEKHEYRSVSSVARADDSGRDASGRGHISQGEQELGRSHLPGAALYTVIEKYTRVIFRLSSEIAFHIGRQSPRVRDAFASSLWNSFSAPARRNLRSYAETLSWESTRQYIPIGISLLNLAVHAPKAVMPSPEMKHLLENDLFLCLSNRNVARLYFANIIDSTCFIDELHSARAASGASGLQSAEIELTVACQELDAELARYNR